MNTILRSVKGENQGTRANGSMFCWPNEYGRWWCWNGCLDDCQVSGLGYGGILVMILFQAGNTTGDLGVASEVRFWDRMT